MEGHYVPVDGGRIFVREVAPATREIADEVPVLVVHGGPDWDHHYLLPGLEPLAKRRRVFAMDLRGCGASSRGLPPGSCQPARVVDDILAVTAAFADTKVDLLGFSYGGRLVQLFVEQHPDRVRSLVLASTSAYGTEQQTHYQERSEHWRNRSKECPDRELPSSADGDLGALTRDWALAQVPLDVWDRALFASYRRLLHTVDFSGEWLKQLVAHGLGPSCPEGAPAVLAELGLRTLVIHGEFDLTFPVELAVDLAGEVPNVRLKVIPGVGHMAHFEKPMMWAASVDQFLARPSAGTGG